MKQQKKTSEEFWEDFVKRNFRFFTEVYSSEKEMREYCLKLQGVFKESERAIFEILTLSEFYRAMRRTKNDALKLIMITSIIEKLSSRKDYMDFSGWVMEKKKDGDLEGKSIEKVWREYNEDFGCSGKFRRFFKNPKYMSKTEQKSLLKSILYYKSDNGSIFLVPLFDDANCSASQEEKVLKNGIKEFADFLYNLRNKFVHDAQLIGLSSEDFGTTLDLFSYVPYRSRYLDEKQSSYERQVVFRLSAKMLEEILNRNFKKLLDGYIEMRKETMS